MARSIDRSASGATSVSASRIQLGGARDASVPDAGVAWNKVALEWIQFNEWRYNRQHTPTPRDHKRRRKGGVKKAKARHPRDAKGVPHVYTYVLPILKDGTTCVQVRDRPLFSLGLFGGELEMWQHSTALAVQAEERTGKRTGAEILGTVWVNAQKELEEELGVPACKMSYMDHVEFTQVSARSGWRSVIVIVLAAVDCVNFPTLLRDHMSGAQDMSTETLTAIPLTTPKQAQQLMRMMKFQKSHDGHLVKAIDLWKRSGGPLAALRKARA